MPDSVVGSLRVKAVSKGREGRGLAATRTKEAFSLVRTGKWLRQINVQKWLVRSRRFRRRETDLSLFAPIFLPSPKQRTKRVNVKIQMYRKALPRCVSENRVEDENFRHIFFLLFSLCFGTLAAFLSRYANLFTVDKSLEGRTNGFVLDIQDFFPSYFMKRHEHKSIIHSSLRKDPRPQVRGAGGRRRALVRQRRPRIRRAGGGAAQW